MKTLRPALLLLALLSVIGTAAAQAASHAISAVTVFPDRAAVTRTVEVELLAGANEVTVIDLPLALLPESVRVDGSAASAVRLGAVEVRQRYGQGRDVDAERRLADEIEALHDRRAALDDEIRAAQAQLDFIDALRRDAPDVANKEREQGLIDPTIWQQAWSTVSAGTAEALKRIREAQQAQRAIGREPVGHMIHAMAGRFPHMRLQTAHMHRIALAHIGIGMRDRLAGLDRRHHPAAGAAFQGLNGLHVIGMAVRDEDIGELPARLGESRQYGPLLGRIDGRAGSRIGIVNQNTDIVLQAEKGVNLG